jgi:biopolymer transport protein ExbB/TolQ
MNVVASSDVVSQALSGLSSALRVPVHVAALTLLALLTLELGRVAIETWRRVHPRSDHLEVLALKAISDKTQAADIARRAPGAIAEQAILDLANAEESGDAEAFEHALASYELRVQRRLDRTRMLVRAGPAVGLMGTLIPLAPGLSALGQGDFAPLAADLKVAFAATVIGILVGTVAFALTLVRTRLYSEDLVALERAVGKVTP